MPSAKLQELPGTITQQVEEEDAIAAVRRGYLIGRFRVMLSQTEEHPEQRALDEDWVEKLTEIFKVNLNRPLHPVDAVLGQEQDLERLEAALLACPPSQVPSLPAGVKVFVFAGQHRLATLPRLGLNDNELWWHVDVFLPGRVSLCDWLSILTASQGLRRIIRLSFSQ